MSSPTSGAAAGNLPALVERMAALLVETIAPEAIVLFGSQLKGGAGPRSDVDLLVVWETVLPPHMREAALVPLVQELGARVDLLVRTPAEVEGLAARRHSFVHSVLRSGLVVHKKNGYDLPAAA